MTCASCQRMQVVTYLTRCILATTEPQEPSMTARCTPHTPTIAGVLRTGARSCGLRYMRSIRLEDTTQTDDSAIAKPGSGGHTITPARRARLRQYLRTRAAA